jgi:putative oxidoreductase
MARDNHELVTPSPAMFAAADNLATRTADAWALVGRVLIGLLFLMNVWPRMMSGLPGFTRYLTSLGMPAPEFFTWLSTGIELVAGIALVLGVATRYSALLFFLYVLIATVIAHRYWEYPAAAQSAQYFNVLKNIAIMGGLVLLFITGAGRFSLDGWLRRKG